jgi:hypothetical protein
MLHEYAHYRFWRDQGKLDVDKKGMEQFESEHGLENERYALTEEANFLKKVRYAVPPRARVKFFRVKSWTNNGTPVCEGRLVQLETRKNINLTINLIEKAIQEMHSKKSYDNEMAQKKTENNITLSSILKLDVMREYWPIVEMDI